MRAICKVLSAALMGLLLMVVSAVGMQEGVWRPDRREVDPCEGSYKNRTPTHEEIAEALEEHRTWLEAPRAAESTTTWSMRQDKRRANLCEANLQQARLVEVNLCGADLRRANLQGANLYGADLQEANLSEANLQKALLSEANLQGARLEYANLQGATLHHTHLRQANLFRTGLEEASLSFCSLKGASLVETKLQGAVLYAVNLADTLFEIEPGSLPDIHSLAQARSLEQMRFRHSPHALVELREIFKRAGMRQQERQITYAIEHSRMLLAWNPPPRGFSVGDNRPWPEKLAGKSESLFSYVLFELPCAYGRPQDVPCRRSFSSLGCSLSRTWSLCTPSDLPYMCGGAPGFGWSSCRIASIGRTVRLILGGSPLRSYFPDSRHGPLAVGGVP